MSGIKRIHKCKTKRWFAHYVSLMREYALYEGPGSGFHSLIYDGYCFNYIESMAILKIDKIPVGVSIKLRENRMMGCGITCFVLESHRRLGYGTRLVNALVDKEELLTLGNQFPPNFPRS